MIAGLTFFAAVLLALIHILAGKVPFGKVVPRSPWLSAAGGASVAYVFVHILPELAVYQGTFAQAGITALDFMEHHVYVVALLGFAVFYGLERLAVWSRQQAAGTPGPTVPSPLVFWVHIGSFGLFNALIGYLLLHREQPGLLNFAFYFVAMAAHFLVNDYGLRRHHREAYDRIGSRLLGASVLAGWVMGRLIEIHGLMLAVLFAFLAGGVILNVIKEELPEEHDSRFWAFALGAGLYAALLLAL